MCIRDRSVAEHLEHNVRVYILDLLCDYHLCDDFLRTADEADSHAGGEYLRDVYKRQLYTWTPTP